MLNKFALEILNEVAESCEETMNDPDTPEVVAQAYDKVSKDLTDAMLLLSGPPCSENFKFHIDKGLTLDKVVFRPGTQSFLNMFNEARDLSGRGLYNPSENEKYYLSTDLGICGKYEGNKVPLDLPMMSDDPDDSDDSDVNDAKYQGKEVEIGKPKRGGSKKFYVYVMDKGKVKKVSFGSPDMPLNIADPKARSSFKARHNCEKKNDRTTAGYWSCRIGRYPNITGAKQKYTWW